MGSVSQRTPNVVPSSADWVRLRPMVTELYRGHRRTLIQVRDHLNSIGYRVNTRMVRARISQWNIQRNHQVRDMGAALRLLDPDPALWPKPEPCFLIRGSRVTMTEVLRFFRRKGIVDPFQWARSTAVSHDESHVVLLTAEAADETTPTQPNGTAMAGETTAIGPHLLPFASDEVSSMPLPDFPSRILTSEERAVASLHSYCSAYVGQLSAELHPEPQVHQFTIHGRFGDRMQEGIAQMMRGDPNASLNFRDGFGLVGILLSDCHPMGLAQFLAVISELAANGARLVLSSLLQHTAMKAVSLQLPGPVTSFLLALRSSQRMSQVAISSLRAALGAFVEQRPTHWQRLYVQERLCDCLYHGRERSEGSLYRSRLFQDQEALYGPFARNVLWTLTNMADDQLNLGDMDAGKAYYTMAYSRAEHLTGFARAKIRFAALEGLARTEQMCFEKMTEISPAIGPNPVSSHLQEAYRYADEALHEALTWFGPSSRRISRAMERRTHIWNILASSHRQGNPEPYSDGIDVIPLCSSSRNGWSEHNTEYQATFSADAAHMEQSSSPAFFMN